MEYVRDAALQGRPMALILLGHDASEEIGIKPFAARVQELFPQLPISFVSARERSGRRSTREFCTRARQGQSGSDDGPRELRPSV